MKIVGSVEAYRAETMVAKEGLQLLIDLGIRALVLESDAQLVMECFGSNSNDMSHNRLILIDAYRLALGLTYFKAQYTLRCCNSIVDRLVKLAKDWDTSVWTKEVSSCIKDMLASEACV